MTILQSVDPALGVPLVDRFIDVPATVGPQLLQAIGISATMFCNSNGLAASVGSTSQIGGVRTNDALLVLPAGYVLLINTLTKVSATNATCELWVHANVSNERYYLALDSGAGTMLLNQFVGGVVTTLATYTLAWATDQARAIGLQIVGADQLTALVNGVAAGPAVTGTAGLAAGGIAAFYSTVVGLSTATGFQAGPFIVQTIPASGSPLLLISAN